MGKQEGITIRFSGICIRDLTLISRLERIHQSLHHHHLLPERRQRHRRRWTGLRRPQETFLLRRGRLLLSTFRHRRASRRGSGRTWCQTIHNPYHQHPQATGQDFCSRRSPQVDPAPKRQRNPFVVDMLISSNNHPRQHLHRRRRSLHFQSYWILVESFSP